MAGEDIYHHGIKGQRWGVRRYQNKDGSLTPAGRKRYFDDKGDLTEAGMKYYRTTNTGALTRAGRKKYGVTPNYEKSAQKYYNLPAVENISKRKAKRIIKAETRYLQSTKSEAPDERKDWDAAEMHERALTRLSMYQKGRDFIAKNSLYDAIPYSDFKGRSMTRTQKTTVKVGTILGVMSIGSFVAETLLAGTLGGMSYYTLKQIGLV